MIVLDTDVVSERMLSCILAFRPEGQDGV